MIDQPQIKTSEEKNKNLYDSTGQGFFKTQSEKMKRPNSHSYAHLPMRKDIPHWNISSAVLRNSSERYSIPKDFRFKEPQINYYNHYQLHYPSSLSHRATTFGYGKKVPVPEVFTENKN